MADLNFNVHIWIDEKHEIYHNVTLGRVQEMFEDFLKCCNSGDDFSVFAHEYVYSDDGIEFNEETGDVVE